MRKANQMKIDMHAHFTQREYFEELERLPGVTIERRDFGVHMMKRKGANWLPFRDKMLDPDELMRDMDRKGIDMRILSLSTPSVYEFQPEDRIRIARQQNDAIINRVAEAPSRLRAVVTLPLPDIDAAMAEFDRVHDAPGIVGMALGSNLNGMALSDPSLEPLWKRLDALRFPVLEHPMVPVFANNMNEFALPVRIGFQFDTSIALARMIYAGVFERYPNFPFVVAHTGAAFVDLLERLDNGYRHYADCREHITRLPSEYARAFWYDTCSFLPPFISMVGNMVGWDRILFGTDFPFIDADDSHVMELEIDEATRAGVLSENARSLWNL